MIHVCVDLISGRGDKFAFYMLANAIEHSHRLNRLEPRERWTVKPRALEGAYARAFADGILI